MGRWWQKRANCSDKAVRLREEVILGPVVWGLTSAAVRLVRRDHEACSANWAQGA